MLEKNISYHVYLILGQSNENQVKNWVAEDKSGTDCIR